DIVNQQDDAGAEVRMGGGQQPGVINQDLVVIVKVEVCRRSLPVDRQERQLQPSALEQDGHNGLEKQLVAALLKKLCFVLVASRHQIQEAIHLRFQIMFWPNNIPGNLFVLIFLSAAHLAAQFVALFLVQHSQIGFKVARQGDVRANIFVLDLD